MSVLSVDLSAVALGYLELSGLQLNTSNNYNFPLFSTTTFVNGPVDTDYPAMIAAFSMATNGAFTPLSPASMGGGVGVDDRPTGDMA